MIENEKRNFLAIEQWSKLNKEELSAIHSSLLDKESESAHLSGAMRKRYREMLNQFEDYLNEREKDNIRNP